MKASNNLVVLLLEPSEGFSPTPYQKPGDRPTIGYGSTFYADGHPVTLNDPPITKQQAIVLVLATLGQYEDCVNKCVKVKINQNQFDALVDFAYNLGCAALRGSTLLKKLNTGDFSGASNEFDKWVFDSFHHKLEGLVTRRKNERLLFNRTPS